MDWNTLALVIAQEGFPLAEALFQKWSNGNPPTQADFDELRALSNRKAQDRMLAMLGIAGFSPDDPKAKHLLELVKGVPNLVVTTPPAPPGGTAAPTNTWKES